MKRYHHLYDRICSFDNLLEAWRKACRANPHSAETIAFSRTLEDNLLSLQRELLEKKYTPGRYRRFEVHDPKRRVIWSAPFRDRVLHHAICAVIEPLFDRSFIYHSYACRRGKGTHRAVVRLSRILQNPVNRFCLKCDINRYFDSVDHGILFSLVERKIKDRNVLWLVSVVIKSVNRDKGIPIGNLTSQLFANIYLNKLDRFVKHTLKTRYYLRYVDDFILLAGSAGELESAREAIRRFLADELKLQLHPKKAVIFPVKHGVDFLGFRCYRSHRKVRKESMARFRRKYRVMKRDFLEGRISIDDVGSRMCSYLGHWAWADTHALRKSLFDYAS